MSYAVTTTMIPGKSGKHCKFRFMKHISPISDSSIYIPSCGLLVNELTFVFINDYDFSGIGTLYGVGNGDAFGVPIIATKKMILMGRERTVFISKSMSIYVSNKKPKYMKPCGSEIFSPERWHSF